MPHPLLTSREQDIAATATHQALMKNLGSPLLKSDAHTSALRTNLSRDNNDNHAAPKDPAGMIRRASPDVLLTPLQRVKAEAERKRKEREQAARRDDAGDADDDEEIGEDGFPVSPKQGSSLSKSLTPGAFMKLRAGLHAFVKAQSSDHTESFEDRYGAAINTHVARPAVAKPMPSPSKSIEAASARISKSLGISPMKSLNAKIETIAKSINGGGPVRGLRGPAPKYSTAQVEAGASAALAAGAISGELAQHISSALAMGGAGAIPANIIAMLEGQ